MECVVDNYCKLHVYLSEQQNNTYIANCKNIKEMVENVEKKEMLFLLKKKKKILTVDLRVKSMI